MASAKTTHREISAQTSRSWWEWGRVAFAAVAGPLALLGASAVGGGGTGTVAAAPSPQASTVVTAPASIADNCSVDVRGPLHAWLQSLPPDSTWKAPAGACYQVDRGMQLDFPDGLTIDGGTFEDDATTPLPPDGHGTQAGSAMFDILGGTDVAFENVTVVGANTSGSYHANMAFEGAFEIRGTIGVTFTNITTRDTFGDGINLEPLRGGDDWASGQILNPTEDVTAHDVTIVNAGRQAISPVSVDGANFSGVTIVNPGDNAFDFEADQNNEGAENVTVNGCSMSGASINIAMNGVETGPIIFENCVMPAAGGGSVLTVSNAKGRADAGPIAFIDDHLWCAASVYVGCFQLEGAQDLLVKDSSIVVGFPHDLIHEAFLLGDGNTHAVFVDDQVSGYGKLGNTWPNSSMTVYGGSWKPGVCGWPDICPLP